MTLENLPTMDRDCSALAGLFQLIVNDLKGSGPMWEDFLTKASKLHHALKSTLVVFSAFLDAFQRIADSATQARGATKDVGAALTRISLRHRAIESRIKGLTSTIMACLVAPLQEKLDEWRRTNHSLDKEHTKEYRRARADIKKRTEHTVRLQKKAKKVGKSSELNKVVDSSVGDLVNRYTMLEETERTALRHALTEERSRYCIFSIALKPVLEEEIGLVSELGHLQEVILQLDKHSSDPHFLPSASEQVLEDVKKGDAKWSWQTPPTSPTSSLGSRKSSMCSISSLNSSSSSSNLSPSHHPCSRPISQNSVSENCCSDKSLTPPPPAPATATWPNLTESTLNPQRKSASATGLHILTDRPHTISSAYERGRERPPLSVYTFQAPDRWSGSSARQISSQPVSPVCYELEEENVSPLAGHTATISRRSSRTSLQHNLSSSSQESLNAYIWNKSKPPVPMRCSSLERPLVPEKKPKKLLNLQYKEQKQNPNVKEVKEQISSKSGDFSPPSSETKSIKPIVPDFNKPAPDMVLPQPLYSNMSEIKSELTAAPSNVLSGETNGNESSSYVSLVSSGYGSQQNLSLNHSAQAEDCEASKYCTLRPHSLAVLPQAQMFLSQGFPIEGHNPSRTGSLRKGQKPPPPIRRTSSISSTSSLATSSFPNNRLVESVNNFSKNHGKNVNGSIGSSSSSSPSQSSSNDSSANGSPLQKTDSESSTPVGSMENLPPPPAFLLEEGNVEDYSTAMCNPETTTPEGIIQPGDPFGGPSQKVLDDCFQKRKISVSDTVKSLQDSRHQPPSPITHKRTQSLRMSSPPSVKVPVRDDQKIVSLEKNRAALISSLNSKLALCNPLIRPRFPGPDMLPIYSKPVIKVNLSPKLQRHTLSSVQEVVSVGNIPPQTPDPYSGSYQSSEIYSSTFKGKAVGAVKHPQPLVYPKPSPSTAKVDFIPTPVIKGKPETCPSPAKIQCDQTQFIQNLNLVLAQRQSSSSGQDPSPNQSSSSPKMKIKRKSQCNANGTPTSASVQRSSSSASEKASKVCQWIMNKKVINSETSAASLRESLLDQIKKGKPLRRAKHIADRSAPRVH